MRSNVARRSLMAVMIAITLAAALPVKALGDELSSERGRMKDIAKQVAREIEKNYYDPKLNGLDWPALLDQAKTRIDNAKSVGEMITSIFIMVDKLKDSHTFFIPPARATTYKYGFEAKAFGPEIHIYELKKNGAASKAGLKLGDRILSINGYPADRRSFDLMMLDMRSLRPVMAMEIKVQTDNEEPRIVRLEPIKEAKVVVIDAVNRIGDVWELVLEGQNESTVYHTGMNDGGIGYIQVSEFTSDSDFLDGLAGKVKGAKALIIDLRGNPGGAIDSLKSFTGLFESAQIDMLKVEYRTKTEPITIKPRRPNFSGPMFILIDSRSGSCSEMFARHFQRTKKAVIIGDHSPGRATVARFFEEQTGSDRIVPYSIEIDIGKVVFENGELLEKVGVAPDQQCVPTGKDLRENRDVCYGMAIAAARKALNITASETVAATDGGGKN